MTAAEYQQLAALRAELDRREAKDAAEKAEAERKRLLAVAEKEGAEKALAAAREQHQREIDARAAEAAAIREKWHGTERDRALRAAIAESGARLRPGSDAILQQLWAADFDVIEDPANPSSLLVRDRGTLQPVREAVKARLADPKFALFLEPSTQGGTARPGAAPGAGGPTAADAGQPESLGHLAIRTYQAGRTDNQPLAPVGLVRRA